MSETSSLFMQIHISTVATLTITTGNGSQFPLFCVHHDELLKY